MNCSKCVKIRVQWVFLEELKKKKLQILPPGGLLPIGSFTACTVATVVHNQTGHLLVDVDVMSNHDAVIELEPDVRVGEVAQHLHGTHEWDGQQAETSCLLSTCHSVVNVVQEHENGCMCLQQLEDEQHCVREEKQHHHEQLARFLVQFQDEVRKIEKLQQVQATEADQTAMAGAVR